MKKQKVGRDRFFELLDQARALFVAKNDGYSPAKNDPWGNFHRSKDVGVKPSVGALIRMGDKWGRITNLVRNPSLDKVKESIIDTLFDLAVYCLITICLIEEETRARKRHS